MYEYTRPRQRSSQLIHIWRFHSVPPSIHAAPLIYPDEFADIASEYTIGLGLSPYAPYFTIVLLSVPRLSVTDGVFCQSVVRFPVRSGNRRLPRNMLSVWGLKWNSPPSAFTLSGSLQNFLAILQYD